MNLDKLANTTEALYAALQTTDAEIAVQQGLSQKMSQVWSSGAGAEAASTMLGQQLTLAAEDRTKLHTAVTAFATATVHLRDAVSKKADHVKALVSGTEVKVGGKTVGEIDELIEACDLTTWEKAGKAGFWGVATFGAGAVVYGGYAVYQKEQAQKWLDETFKPDFEGKLANFQSMCTNTHTTAQQTYAALKTAVEALDSNPYPRPAGTVTADPGTTKDPGGTTTDPGGNGDTSTNPTTTNPTTTQPTTTDPSKTTTDDDDDDDDTLTSIVSTLADTAEEVVSTIAETISENMDTITSTITDGIENAVDQLESLVDADGDGQLDAVQALQNASAEFDLAGNNVKVEMGEDGNLKMVVTDADGQTKEYGMTIGADGQPVITTSDGEPVTTTDTPDTTTDAESSDGTSEAGTPNSGAGTGTPANSSSTAMPSVPGGTKQGEDSEHRPRNLQTDTPEEPVDTGAELAEAGPL
ncbi:hypothetical protein [Nocardia sp. AG03]|uniref:hypothetical protein n=1 Tax=Nocardia sp. AG03 TaxID=3025312 RepID=UPI002418AF9D|nr:hypothetical protein [Nocardia sp. AG03]